MSNQLIQHGIEILRRNGLVLSLSRDGQLSVADGYDEQGHLIVSGRGGSRKAALAGLIDEVRYKRPDLLAH